MRKPVIYFGHKSKQSEPLGLSWLKTDFVPHDDRYYLYVFTGAEKHCRRANADQASFSLLLRGFVHFGDLGLLK